MSRPCELLMSQSSPSRLTGLMIRDYQRIFDQEHNIPMIRLTINTYKNQISRQIKKYIFFCSTKCKSNKPCICQRCNPYNLLLLLLKRRQSMVDKMLQSFNDPETPYHEKMTLYTNIQRIRLLPENPLFVDQKGDPIKTTFLSKIAKDISHTCRIMDKHHFTAYSLRIGGTTRASQMGIPHTKILKYVGWSNSRLADCAQRYMRYSPCDLCLIPFHMIHGSKEEPKIPAQIYDPWSEKINQRYFK